MRVGIYGESPWGQALAVLVNKAGHEALLGYRRRKPRRKLETTDNGRDLGEFAELLLIATPSWELRRSLDELQPGARHRVVICSRGLDPETTGRLVDMVPALTPAVRAGVLGGPALADEVLRGRPAAAVVASSYTEVNTLVQEALHSNVFRVYTSDDPHGVEFAGAWASVLAVAVALADGMNQGVGMRGLLVSRGLAEATRLAVAMGLSPETLLGLAGLGDLISAVSNPKHPAVVLGRTILEKGPQPDADEMKTAQGALNRAAEFGVDLPLTQAVLAIGTGKVDVQTALRGLMSRSAKLGES